jgi:hypothetical protein
MRHHSLSRAVAAVAAGALVLGVGTAAPAAAGPSAGSPDDAAVWLAGQTNGDHVVHNDVYNTDDYGLTADFVFALLASGHTSLADPMVAAIANHVDYLTTGAQWGAPDEIYAGSVAKGAVLAQVAGQEPTSFGGVDLVRRLEKRVSGRTPIVGRIQDKAAVDYANVIGQAYAARALADAGSDKADEVRGYLLQQQCSNGYFRLTLPRKAKQDQSCDAGSSAGISAPDTDATALAVLSLRSLPTRTKRVRAAIADAVSWLERRQRRNGSFGGGTMTEESNANSTGLAGWALGDAGSCDAAAAAARWVGRMQVPSGQTGSLQSDIGAIAYNRAALDAAQDAGISDDARDQWRRASAQAAPALQYLDVATCQA